MLTPESIAGQVLVTVLTSPDLYLIDPAHPQPVLVHSFSGYQSLLGIAEIQPDNFYVIVGNYSQPTNTNTPGSWNVYHVNMHVQPPNVRLSAHFPEANLLDGMAVLSAEDGLLLVGDAGAGVVYRLNVHTGATAIVIDDPTMRPPAGAPVGIDGVQIRDNTLYFTNAPKGLFVSIPLKADGTAAGPAEVLATGLEVDDFTFDNTGNAYMSVTFSNEMAKLQSGISGGANVSDAAHVASENMLAGPTACKLGRLETDREMLYVTTTGGLGIADGSSKPGGTLSRVNIRRFGA